MAIDLVSKYQNAVDELFKNESKRSLVTNQDYSFVGANSIRVYNVSTAEMHDYNREGTGNGSRYAGRHHSAVQAGKGPLFQLRD